ncbi:hypothetical protein GCM10025867_48830 (plasmid) [Frondihabitans sucicola]|uniref:Uncharacterized protein n=1 Tax=Frondihabitans sucicola TaxID=1268041 RepID=A0ABM8GW83_9MICO|nr:hypothetical protein [Frondihabitans sucicola]BDZ52642.1 hypothetical protein GCM10025867_48830 [Frondihabitans sucicola]
MPRTIHAPLPAVRPTCIAEPARGRIDRSWGSVDVALTDGVVGRLHVDSGCVFLLDVDSPETDTTPLLPGVAPQLATFLGDLYVGATARLGRRRSAKLLAS